MWRAARSGCLAQMSVAFKIARTARFVAAGFLVTNSFRAATMQQKYWSHGLEALELDSLSWTCTRSRTACLSDAGPALKFSHHARDGAKLQKWRIGRGRGSQ